MTDHNTTDETSLKTASWKRPALLLTPVLAVAACTAGVALDSNVYRPHDAQALTVVGTDADGEPVRGAADVTVDAEGNAECVMVGDECLTVIAEGPQCARPDQPGPVDAVVIDGEVQTVVCYPRDRSGEVVVVDSDSQGSLSVALEAIAQNENGTTVVFDGEAALSTDISIDANNVSFYGDRPEDTVIDGDVVVDGNNVHLRGVHITGDLIIEKNNAAVVLSEVEGNIIVRGNNAVLAGVATLGAVTVEGQNAVMTQVESDETITVSGSNSTCADVYTVDDDDNEQPVDC